MIIFTTNYFNLTKPGLPQAEAVGRLISVYSYLLLPWDHPGISYSYFPVVVASLNLFLSCGLPPSFSVGGRPAALQHIPSFLWAFLTFRIHFPGTLLVPTDPSASSSFLQPHFQETLVSFSFQLPSCSTPTHC